MTSPLCDDWPRDPRMLPPAHAPSWTGCALVYDLLRIARTAARQFFHTDEADLVGLLCLHRAAAAGAESRSTRK